MFEVNSQFCVGQHSQPPWAARGQRAAGRTPLEGLGDAVLRTVTSLATS